MTGSLRRAVSRRALVILVAGLALLVAACSVGGPGTAQGTSSAPPTAATVYANLCSTRKAR